MKSFRPKEWDPAVQAVKEVRGDKVVPADANHRRNARPIAKIIRKSVKIFLRQAVGGQAVNPVKINFRMNLLVRQKGQSRRLSAEKMVEMQIRMVQRQLISMLVPQNRQARRLFTMVYAKGIIPVEMLLIRYVGMTVILG